MIDKLPLELILYIFDNNLINKIKYLVILKKVFRLNIDINLIAIYRIKLFLKIIINKNREHNKIIKYLKNQNMRRGLQVSSYECVLFKPYDNKDICMFCFRNKKKHKYRQSFIENAYNQYTF